jgi:hypothetical protein
MKRANHGTNLDETPKHQKPPAPAAQTGKDPHDARGDHEQLEQNQDDLGVGEDHKTHAMEKRNRGTFP